MSLKQLSGRDRGATALIIAMTMVLIMGVAAVVIDGGLGFNERRQAQGAVDFGSLAALQAAVSCRDSGCDLPTAANNGADEAIDVVQQNLPGRSLAWGATNCSDPNRPAEFTVIAGITPCVSYTANLDEARVNLPPDAIDTTFGNLIGMSSLTVAADAEAGATILYSSRIIPTTPLGSAGAEACLFANQAPQAEPPCPGVSGFYGYIDAALYGNDDLGTPPTCTQGGTNLRISVNLAKGGDHSVVTYDPGPPDPIVNDHAACPNVNEDINEMRVETGSTTVGITDGLLVGVSGSINGQPFTPSPGRLLCGPESKDCVSVRGYNMDHTGLWDYLVPGTCPGANDHDSMLACLDTGSPSFTSAIQYHPRFAAVPVFWTTPTGPGSYTIKEFVPVWLETIYLDCNAFKCDTIHSGGDDAPLATCPNPLATTGERNCGWADTAGPENVEGMLAFTIDVSMLPPDVSATFPSIKTERDWALTK